MCLHIMAGITMGTSGAGAEEVRVLPIPPVGSRRRDAIIITPVITALRRLPAITTIITEAADKNYCKAAKGAVIRLLFFVF